MADGRGSRESRARRRGRRRGGRARRRIEVGRRRRRGGRDPRRGRERRARRRGGRRGRRRRSARPALRRSSSATRATSTPRTWPARCSSRSSSAKVGHARAGTASASGSPSSREPTTTSSSYPIAGARRRRRRALRTGASPTSRQYANEVAEELSKVTWPTRKEVTNSTMVVVVDDAVRDRVLRAHGPVLGVRHRQDLQRSDELSVLRQQADATDSRGARHGQEVVRHSDLLGLREQGEEALQQRVKQHGMEDAASARSSSRPRPSRRPAPAARQRVRQKTQPPRLHLRRDGDDRGGLAPRQGHPEGHRLHRQPDARRRSGPRRSRTCAAASSRARSSRSPA